MGFVMPERVQQQALLHPRSRATSLAEGKKQSEDVPSISLPNTVPCQPSLTSLEPEPDDTDLNGLANPSPRRSGSRVLRRLTSRGGRGANCVQLAANQLLLVCKVFFCGGRR